jgi:hypothetical protein
MKSTLGFACGLFLVACAGPYAHDQWVRGERERWVVPTVRDAAVRKAIVVQRTLYPYHFAPDSAELNGLGRKDVDVLIEHFRDLDESGEVNVRRGDTPEPLYAARLESVRRAFLDAAVEPSRIHFRDGVAGGDGMPSGRILEILTSEAAAAGTMDAEGAADSGTPASAMGTSTSSYGTGQ